MRQEILPPANPTGPRLVGARYIDGGDRIDLELPPGMTVMEMVAVGYPKAAPSTLRRHLRVTIGKDVIAPEYWGRMRPKSGALIIARPLPGNSGVLRSALSIAVGVAALALGQVYLGPLIAGSLGFAAGSLGATAISGAVTATTLLAGTFLINSLIPIRREQNGVGRGESPTYAITGFRNTANPDGVIPCVYGKVRFAPPFAALPYTEVVNGETYIRAVFRVGYGPVVIRNIRLGDTPIERYKEVEVEVREGYSDDAPITLYPRQVLQENLSVDLNNAYSTTFGPHVRFTASDITQFQVDVTFPSGLFWMKTVRFSNSSTTFPLPLTIGLRIRYRLEGTEPWTTVDWPIAAMIQKAFSVSNLITVPTRGRYEVEIVRLTPDFDDLNSFLQDDQFVSVSVLSAVRSFRPEYPLNYRKPNALIAIRARSSKQLNGVIDNLNCEASRVALDWNGSAWVAQETANCASMLRLAMQGPHMAFPLANDEVDLPNLQTFHAFCAGRPEPLQFNRVVDYEASVYDVWSDIAAAGRAAPRDDGEKWGVVIDRPQTVAMQHVTPRNSWEFSGTREYAREPDAFRVKFYDETNSYKEAERIVLNPDFGDTPVVTESISFPGITNPAAVWREARRRFYELKMRRDTWRVMMDWEGAVAVRGDLVHLNYDTLEKSHIAGRVRAVNGSSVTLDASVTMETGNNYAIRFRVPGVNNTTADVSATRNVTTNPGQTRTVFLTGSGSVPTVGTLVLFGEVGKVSIECVVKEVEGGENSSRRFTLIPHAPEIHTTADGETPPPWNGRVGSELGGPLLWGTAPLLWDTDELEWTSP